MSLFAESVPQQSKMLKNLLSWLDQLDAYAEERGFEAEALVDARLYPDMFPLRRQIQSACDGAKLCAARLAEVEAPKHDDTETTLAELRERIASTLSFLEGISEDDMAGSDDRELFLPFLQGGSVTAADYLREFALPNFYFHVTTAYAILRKNGVPLGKRTFIGAMNVKPAPS